MMSTWVTFSFEASHVLPTNKGVHGHSYVVKVFFQDGSWVEDLCAQCAIVKAALDHGFLNDLIAVPTMENIARYVAERLSKCVRVIVERPTLGVGCEYTS